MTEGIGCTKADKEAFEFVRGFVIGKSALSENGDSVREGVN